MRGSPPDPSAKVRDARMSAKSARKPTRRVILVTGANGGAGRRVVRELLQKPDVVVRAFTRSEDRLRAALAKVGVDADKAISSGKLEVIVSDLFNIRPEFFTDVIGIASCTGVNVGPGDDPDRSKYFQGLKFYQPTVLEDTPENVEFVGIRNLVNAAKKHFTEMTETEIPVLTFTDEDVVRKQWGPLDDVVMGGVSKGNVFVQGGCLVFSGFVSTDNFGGFSSARTVDFPQPIDLSGYEGLRLRVRGDGKSYKLIVRCERKWDGIGHCFTFPTKSGEWTDVEIPFSEFKAVFRAKTLEFSKPLEPKNIFAFQVMLSKFEYDGDLNPNFSAGPFELRIESINAYKKTAEDVVRPKMVHIGSAGVTRLLRKGEFDLETQPSIVRMSDMLGRILDWKLAGEDLIRNSGLPYTIIRPCALTEKEPVGMDSLVFAQGDTMTGQVSREDIAPLIAGTFENSSLSNVTVEVSQKKENEASPGPSKERIEKLRKDEEDSRVFASFPYVPAIQQR